MENQSGKSPLGWIITIVVALIIAGVTIAMLFVDNEEFSNTIRQYLNKDNTSQTQTK